MATQVSVSESSSQVWRRILLGSNLVLLFLVLFLIVKRLIRLDDGGTTRFVKTGEVIADLLNPHALGNESLVPRAGSELLVLFFLRGLTNQEIASFFKELDNCEGSIKALKTKIVVVCDEETEYDELMKNRQRLNLDKFVDRKGRVRARLGVRGAAAIIVDARKLSVTQAFPYLPNPYLLCEQIRDQHSL